MVAGADSIDDTALLRHGGEGPGVRRRLRPLALGSFLRSFTVGDVRHLATIPRHRWAMGRRWALTSAMSGCIAVSARSRGSTANRHHGAWPGPAAMPERHWTVAVVRLHPQGRDRVESHSGYPEGTLD